MPSVPDVQGQFFLLHECMVLIPPVSSGAKGNAKPKKCVKCEGKGLTFVHSQVITSYCAHLLGEPADLITGWEEPVRRVKGHVH